MSHYYELSSTTSSIFTKAKGKRILGIPERLIYRMGVFLFYLLLFSAISFFSKDENLPDSAGSVASVLSVSK